MSPEPRETQPIETGVLPLFRVFVALEIFLLVLKAGTRALRLAPEPAPSPWLALVLSILFLGYLSSARLRRTLGWIYLPLALAAAAAGPLLGSAVTMRLRLAAGATADDLVRSSWTLIAALLVPIVLIAWQYGFRWVLAASLATGAADVAMTLPLAARGGPRAVPLLVLAVVRCLFFLPVGYAVSRLVEAQRRQREALRRANATLARHAATLEQLAVSRERNRLARELHDTLAHGLSAVAVQLEAASALWESQPEGARARLAGALDTTRTALREARRAIGALRARPLEDLGLAAALRELAESTAARAGLEVDTHVAARLDGLAPDAEQAVYRIAAEALANVASHAEARRIEVRFEDQGPSVSLVVIDDGRGFDPSVGDAQGRFGLRGMHERAHAIGADLRIESAHGRGTIVRLTTRKSG